MVAPLVVLAVFAVGVAWTVPGLGLSLSGLLEQARPAGTWEGVAGGLMWPSVALPGEHASHAPAIHIQATLVAFMTAACGVVLAVMFYGTGTLSPQDVSRTFPGLHRFLIKKWWFDELYDALFVKPAHLISRVAAEIDRGLIDGVVHAAARGVRSVSTLDDLFDRYFVDGFVNVTANWIYSLGLAMRRIQTGRLRQYVLFIVAATVGLFALASFVLRYERAAQAPVPIRHGQVQRQPTQSMLTLDTQVRGFVPATTDHGH
jgi:NADH-quinone oxidoreductase subunit L